MITALTRPITRTKIEIQHGPSFVLIYIVRNDARDIWLTMFTYGTVWDCEGRPNKMPQNGTSKYRRLCIDRHNLVVFRLSMPHLYGRIL